ncbi:FAD-binding oxidoreductase [Luteipulveratus flavus]|uniref:FAD-binding oxidoreductase n=1 Tax=Luteipulveratus flavus TaxID=3031728 RepID=A0ABT6CCI0_9MICO|nr:FAD-binding oxidoreductase [Luteipulveratus sp. YIM 133296]MDF8266218.1 FAD-binding oxidoreductase [Luteipulveratus sp. YIM 133296]
MSTITRRAFLGGTAAAGATAALATTRPAHASPGVLLSAAPTRDDWIAFARTMDGAVLLPGSTQYASAKLLFDTRYDGASPAAVVQVRSQADVQRSMVFAGRYGLKVAPRSGGHSYIGASAANGTMVLDTRQYASVSYNASDGTALVFSGAGLYTVHSTLAARGRTIPTGTCPTVGAAGLTLGGGLGVESRQWGVTSDRLSRVSLVLPDGRALSASATSNADLFWAVRGGGGGNVAFVTAMTFRTHTAGSKGIFSLTFPSSAGTKVLTGWARWSLSAYYSRWANVHVDALGNGSISVRITGVTNAGDERAAASSLISSIGVTPSAASYRQLGYLDAVKYLGGGTTSARQGFAAGSDILWTMPSETAGQVLGAVAARSRAGGRGSAILDPLTGALNIPAASSTAFPWRDHLASVQWYVGVGSSSGYTSAYSWINQAHQMLAGRSAGGYVNYLESGQPASRYYAGNFSRLTSLRQTYDPSRRLYSGLSF